MTDALEAEFDTVATWTADVAVALGPDHALAAACRGSGGPSTLSWFLDRLHVSSTDRMLDCGGGMGGPGAFARQSVGVRPVVTDPEPGACRAARRLFGLTAVRAATQLPFRDGAFDVAWCLGVLCTVADQPLLLHELRRVLRPSGRLGLLVYAAGEGERANDRPDDQPDGNDFPTGPALDLLLDGSGLEIVARETPIDTELPAPWQRRVAEVGAEVERRHAEDPRWQVAEEQQERMARLLASGRVRPEAFVVRPARR